MIDYINSRIILTITAVAIVGLVFSMSIISVNGFSRDLADDIADELRKIILRASEIECDFFIANLSLPDLQFSIDLFLTIRHQSISVSTADYRSIRILENYVFLIDGNHGVDVLSFWSNTTGLSIQSEKNVLEKSNVVTIILRETIG